MDDLLAGTEYSSSQTSTVLPTNGRFGGSFHNYAVIPEPLLTEFVDKTEAEPAAFGSFAAMGSLGSFELRRCDAPSSTALTTWPGVTIFYYGQERHVTLILEQMGIPLIPLKRDFLHAYERVIIELGQV